MFSVAFKQIISVCVTKTETVLHPRMIFRRTVHISKVTMSSRVDQKRRVKELDLTERLNLSKDPDDLGKVVEFNLEEMESQEVKSKKGRRKKEMKEKSDKKVKDSANIKNEESEEAGEVKKKFEDLRRKNTSSFSVIMTMLKSKRGREKSGLIYLEGKRLIHDAIKAGHKPSKVYFSRESDLEKLSLPEGIALFRVPYKKLQFWSDVVTCQGVIGIFEMPDLSIEKDPNTTCIPLTIICDNVREPSNLGSILRVVSSVGCEKLILTQGCVDIWEPKVLRCAAGAHFHLPILRSIPWTEVEEEIDENYKIVLASCNSDNPVVGKDKSNAFTTSASFSEDLPVMCYSSVDYRNQSTAIVIGGETHGVSPEAVQFAKKRKGLKVYIPMSNQVESLNNSVALGVLSYMVRYQLESALETSEKETTKIEKN